LNELIQFFPKGCQYKDCDGRLPLHYACLKGADIAIVDQLVQSYPRGVIMKDSEGRTSLHHACSKGATYDIIDLLTKSNVKCTQIKDDHGRLPLHHACRKVLNPVISTTDGKSNGGASNKHQLRTIKLLLKLYPRAAQIKDDQEKLPIHYVCQPHHQHGSSSLSSKTNNNNDTNVVTNDTSLKDIVTCLLTTYPECVNVENGFGYTPYDEACMTAKSYKTNKSFDAETNKLFYEKWWEDVVTVLQKYKKEQQDGTTSSITGTTTKMATSVDKKYVRKLEDRIEMLEKQLTLYEMNVITSMNMIGKELKSSLLRHSSSSSSPDDNIKNIVNVLETLSNQLNEFRIENTTTTSNTMKIKNIITSDNNSNNNRSRGRSSVSVSSLSNRRHRSVSRDDVHPKKTTAAEDDHANQKTSPLPVHGTTTTDGGGGSTSNKTPTKTRLGTTTTPIRNLFTRNKK
jgi:Ankyrin repeats (3 copies)